MILTYGDFARLTFSTWACCFGVMGTSAGWGGFEGVAGAVILNTRVYAMRKSIDA
jgi:hypothetical protein